MIGIGKLFRNGTANGIGEGTVGVRIAWQNCGKFHALNYNIANYEEHKSEIDKVIGFPEHDYAIFDFVPYGQKAFYLPIDQIT